jgi:hypothetical protein
MGAETERGLTVGCFVGTGAAAGVGPEPDMDLEVIGLETTREFDPFLFDGPAPRPSEEGYDGLRRRLGPVGASFSV